MYVLAQNGLLVREKPTTTSKVIGKLDFGKMSKVSIQQYGEEITVIENKNLPLEIEGKFRKIQYEGKEGYVFDGYLTTFSFFTLIDRENLCYNLYEIPRLEKSKESYRISLEDDEYGEYIEFKYIYLQEIYLIAQAVFGNFKNLEIKEQQDYGEIYNGFKHYKFKNTDKFMFKLLRLDGYFNELSYQKIYFRCNR